MTAPLTNPGDQVRVRVVDLARAREVWRGALIEFERTCEFSDADCALLRSALATDGTFVADGLMRGGVCSAYRLELVTESQAREHVHQEHESVLA